MCLNGVYKRFIEMNTITVQCKNESAFKHNQWSLAYENINILFITSKKMISCKYYWKKNHNELRPSNPPSAESDI